MKVVFTALFTCAAVVGWAQNQTADYNRLSALSKSAFTPAERQYTYKIETKYVDNPAAANNSSGSTSGSSSVSGDYSAYPAINVNQRRLEKQAEAGARQEARIASFDTKMKQLEDLIKNRDLQRTPENHAALVKAAMDSGLSAYEASRFFGNSPQEYRTILVSKNAADYNWSGGIKGDCQGDCVENLTSPYGYTYTGNAKYGKPHGKGVMRHEKATYTGDFVAGEPNGQVEIRWSSGPVFNGTSYNGDMVRGTMKQKDMVFTGTFLNNKFYRGHMKFDNSETLGEYDKTGGMVFGMQVFSSGSSFQGYFTPNQDPTYYQMSEYKSGLRKEEIFDANNVAIGEVKYYASGHVLYSMPYEQNKRLGWRIDPDGTARYVFHFTDTNEMTSINAKPEDLPLLKSMMQPVMNELQKRREEYREKMEQVYEAIK